jgi:hypothetical protein
MPEINYSKTVIYKLTCKQTEIDSVFFGHTTSMYKCKYDIRNNCINGKTGKMYDTIRSNGGFDNWTIEIIEKYRDCMTKQDAMRRVEQIYTEHHSIQKPAKIPPPSANTHQYICTNCDTNFSRNDSLMRHIKYRCKYNTTSQEIDILKQKLVEKEEEMDVLKQKLLEKEKEIDNLKKINDYIMKIGEKYIITLNPSTA